MSNLRVGNFDGTTLMLIDDADTDVQLSISQSSYFPSQARRWGSWYDTIHKDTVPWPQYVCVYFEWHLMKYSAVTSSPHLEVRQVIKYRSLNYAFYDVAISLLVHDTTGPMQDIKYLLSATRSRSNLTFWLCLIKLDFWK